MRLCLLLLVSILPSLAAFADDPVREGSIFLVASRELSDPFFRQTVVLVTHRAGPAPVGVIINRPTGIALSRVVPGLDKPPAQEAKVFFGGPVNPEGLLVVFRDATKPEDAIEVLEGVYLSSGKEALREILSRDKPVKGLRVFAGYAAWAPGQLEAEIARGDWHLVRADAGAIFASKPEALWPELERRASAKPVGARLGL